ncbi:hypothetical protein JK361_22855 [Streptomyces sp. 5-8]|uniref:Uncharacterized protein n=1 Tax=Streptomyces musisoli TaxID=2802280 RepID=A0ABS1P5S6_9ACTN|nr:hypothetical protein [Streptomyces musisoli]MBL1107410.1 hypothetical protein [Streptomyces musisoli]
MAEQEVGRRDEQIRSSANEGIAAPGGDGRDEPRKGKPRRRLTLAFQAAGIAAAISGTVTAIPSFYNASREGDAASILASFTAILGVILSTVAAAVAPEFRELSRQTWQWLRARTKTATYSALSGMCVALAVWELLARHSIAAAGLVVMAAAAVRLVAARSMFRYWKKPLEQLRLHVATEVFFHCFALWGLTAGLLLEVAAVKHLDTAPRVTITISLSLALLVAVNKATARTRKLCTAIDGEISEVFRTVEALRVDIASTNAVNLRREALERVDTLDRMLRTRLNTGYKLTGTSLLPTSTRVALVRGLREAIERDIMGEGPWKRSKISLRQIQNACSRWTDTMA